MYILSYGPPLEWGGPYDSLAPWLSGLGEAMAPWPPPLATPLDPVPTLSTEVCRRRSDWVLIMPNISNNINFPKYTDSINTPQISPLNNKFYISVIWGGRVREKHPMNIWKFDTSKFLVCFKSTIKKVTPNEMFTRKITHMQINNTDFSIQFISNQTLKFC